MLSALYIFKRVEDRKFHALPVRTEIPNLGVWERHGNKSAPQEVVFQLVAPAHISKDGRTFEGFEAVNRILAKHGVESSQLPLIKIRGLPAGGVLLAGLLTAGS
jgi:hypothetical protein